MTFILYIEQYGQWDVVHLYSPAIRHPTPWCLHCDEFQFEGCEAGGDPDLSRRLHKTAFSVESLDLELCF